MASPLPHQPSIDHTPRARTAVDLVGDDPSAILKTLTAGTSREILAGLAEGPATASDLAEAVGTSLQNAHYHLSNLHEAGVVTDAGTWYSEKGREMTVYALASERIELRIDTDDDPPRARRDHAARAGGPPRQRCASNGD